MYQDYRLSIAGAWRPQGGGRNLDVLDPARGVADAEHRGARVEAGGKRPGHRKQSFFFKPTLLSAVPDHALALAEEHSGPIAAITSFGDAEEAYTRANAVPHGLSAYVFTPDLARSREAVSRVEVGIVSVNTFVLAAAEAPFGGIKDSGMGREGGSEGILDYSNVKLVHVHVTV